MKSVHRYYRNQDIWQTPTGRRLSDYEQELLNEIELLRLELDTLNAKLANVLKRVDL